jgi:hypothetical protein
MSSRDWDKELAKIDKQLASLSDEELLAPPSPATGMPRGAGATAVRGSGALPPPAVSAGRGGATLWVWTKLAVATAAAVGVWFWPWPARCGLPLVGLVSAAGGVTLLGLWSAMGTWRHRLGPAHVVSLLAIGSGLVLGAREVLPRVGYAYPTFDRPDRWTCQVAPAASSARPLSSPGGPVGPSAR